MIRRTSVRLQIVIQLALAVLTVTGQTLAPVDPKRESPRATVRTFLDAFQQPRLGVTPDPLDDAVACIDLEGVPQDYRSVKGLEVAAGLHEVLTAIENFHPEDISDAKAGEPFHLFRSTHGEIVLSRHTNGEWFFTADTMRVVPVLVAEIEEQRRSHGSATLTQSESLGSKLRERIPPELRQRDVLLERWQWIGLVALTVMGLIAWQLTQFLCWLLFGKLLRSRFASLTDSQIRRLYAPLGLAAFVIVVRLGLRALALTTNALTFMRGLLFAVTAAAVIWLLYRLVDVVMYRLNLRARTSESQTDDLLIPFIGAIARFGIIIVGVIIVAENLNFNVTGLIAGLGIGGIAIALASQETLSNFFGSLVLLIERPFRAEDRISVDEVKGTVKEVGLRSTRILTFDDSLVTVPNANIAKAHVINDGRRVHRRWTVKISIPYSNGVAKLEKLCDGIRDIIRDTDALYTDVYRLHLYDIEPPSLVLRLEVNFTTDEYDFELAARHRLILDILKLAEELEIDLEVPN